jgi:hypothetical protein
MGNFHTPLPNDFGKRDCGTCLRPTYHYKGKCTDHSEWNPNREHVDVRNVVFRPGSEEETAKPRAIRMDMSLWKLTSERRKSQVDISSEAWAAGLFPDDPDTPTVKPGQVACSFCGQGVDLINALMEKKPVIRRVMNAYRDDDGEVHIQERVTSRAETVHACKDCCLQIRKPVVAHVV